MLNGSIYTNYRYTLRYKSIRFSTLLRLTYDGCGVPYLQEIHSNTLRHRSINTQIWLWFPSTFGGVANKAANFRGMHELEQSACLKFLPTPVAEVWWDLNCPGYRMPGQILSRDMWNGVKNTLKEKAMIRKQIVLAPIVTEPFSPNRKPDGSVVRINAIATCNQRNDIDTAYHPSLVNLDGGEGGQGAGVVSVPRRNLGKCQYHGCYFYQGPELGRELSRPRIVNQLHPWGSKGDRAKCRIDAATLCSSKSGLSQKQILMALRLVGVGALNATLTFILLNLLVNPEGEFFVTELLKAKACCLGKDSWQDVLKSISVAVRRSTVWWDGSPLSAYSITKRAYWEMPTGRDINVSDWEQEKRNRLGLNFKELKLSSGRDFHEVLRTHLQDIINELVPSWNKWDSWESFVQKRQEWVSSGSAGGAKVYLTTSSGKVESVRANKQLFFEGITADEICSWLSSEPEIRAVASEKFEMGKARAIYGTLPKDYTIMTYVIQNIERKLYRIQGIEFGLNGSDDVLTYLRCAEDTKRPGQHGTMADYADFNIQHTLQSQALVFDTLLNRLRDINAHVDAVKACTWCRDAMYSQYATMPDGCVIKSRVGLFSGMRGTNFVNTVLNVAYFVLCMNEVKILYSLSPIELRHRHQGDDLWASNKSKVWAAALYDTMCTTGFQMKDSKQLFADNMGEFLRVLYYKGKGYGYLPRCIAGFIEKPIQSMREMSPLTIACENDAYIKLMYRRGGLKSGLKHLWDLVILYNLKFRVGDQGVTVPLVTALTPRMDGGLGLGPPGFRKTSTGMITPPPALKLQISELAKGTPTHMTNDWIRHISDWIGHNFNADAVRESIHHANVAGSMRALDRDRTVKQHLADLKEWREKLAVPKKLRIIDGAASKSLEPLAEGYTSNFRRPWQWPLEAGKDNTTDKRALTIVLQAIAASPFKDVSTARRALGLNTIDAVRQCLSMSRSRSRALALSCLDNFVVSLGEEVTSVMLDGEGCFDSYWDAFLPPCVSSLARTEATALAFYIVAKADVKDRSPGLVPLTIVTML